MFNTELKDVEIWEKESFELVCETSKPKVPVKWTRNGDAITETKNIKITVDKQVQKLTVKDATKGMTGDYSCTIVSSRNVTSCKVLVKGEST